MTSPSPNQGRDGDIIIIGAGLIGSAIALELTRRGHRTISVERNSAAGAGSTSASSAVIRFSYTTAPGVHLSREGLWYWQNWAEHISVTPENGLAEFMQCGMLLMRSQASDYATRVQALWEQLDVPFELLSPEELTSRYPSMDHGLYGPPAAQDDDAFWQDAWGTIDGGLYSPDSGYVSDPQLAAQNLHAAAAAEGATFLFNNTVTSIQKRDGRVGGVGLADGSTVTAPVVINVAGPHSKMINEMAGVLDDMAIKTGPMRQEVHHVPAPDTMDLAGTTPVLADDDVGFYSRPDVGNHMLIGSVEPACDVLEWIDDADEYNPNITGIWETQVLRLNRRFPDIGMPHQRKGIVGVYDVSDDWVPIYDRTSLDGFYVAIGSSGNQFKNAGSAARVLAEIIEAVEAGHDHDANPVQVPGRATPWAIDSGAFSRNRELASTTMSVIG